MALKDLLTALEADAARESERRRAEADAEASRIVESARSEARALEQRAERADDVRLAREIERRGAEARLAAAARLREEYEACVTGLHAALHLRLRREATPTFAHGLEIKAVVRGIACL